MFFFEKKNQKTFIDAARPGLTVTAGEFTLIDKYFRPLAGPGALDLQDDAAVFLPPQGRELVISADALVAGVHFFPDDPPDLIARKLLRVNLSDLAAMSATPLGYLMTISAPRDTEEEFFARFAQGLATDQKEFALSLLGGDTTSTAGPLVLSLTILGHVAQGAAVRRTGAKPGDDLWVTGTIGDSALGLAALQGRIADPDGRWAARYRLPQPRLALRLTGVASACLDVSDGLVQDVGHLCQAGELAADIDADLVPVSNPDWLETCLTGGDDYELAFAAPPSAREVLLQRALESGVAVTLIGKFVEGSSEVRVFRAGKRLALARTGWSHF
jgi:thiamine-monophosphate kinase